MVESVAAAAEETATGAIRGELAVTNVSDVDVEL